MAQAVTILTIADIQEGVYDRMIYQNGAIFNDLE